MFRLKTPFSLILASASPRRKTLLESTGLAFDIYPSHICEPTPQLNENPANFSQKTATLKAQACMESEIYTDNCIIIAADTIVCIDNKILGKPQNADDAFLMLTTLNGRSHKVYTSVSLTLPKSSSQKEICFSECSIVTFNKWSNDILKAYANSSEPADKAGAYAVQGLGAFLIQSICGSWTNVVGLPLTPIIAKLLDYALIMVSE